MRSRRLTYFSFFIIFLFVSFCFYEVSITSIPDNNEKYIHVVVQRMSLYDDWLLGNVSYPRIGAPSENIPLWIGQTAYYLIGLKALQRRVSGILGEVRLNAIINWMIDRLDEHGWKLLWRFSVSPEKSVIANNSYYLFLAVQALALWGFAGLVNKTAVIRYVLDRYDNVTGGFRELSVSNTSYAPLLFPGLTDGASWDEFRGFYKLFGMPNIVSTFLALGILYYLGALDYVNVSKVLEFVLSCKTEDGFFKFLPSGRPGYTYPADINSTLVPYIYAGVMSLYFLGRLDMLSDEEREKIGEYFTSFQIPSNGKLYPGRYVQWTRGTVFATRAIMNREANTLSVIELMGMLGLTYEYEEWLRELASRFIVNPFIPALHVPYEPSFPVPKPASSYYYGVATDEAPIGPVPARLVYCLDLAGIFDVLYILTPRALECRKNFQILAIGDGILTVVVMQVIRIIWERRKRMM